MRITTQSKLSSALLWSIHYSSRGDSSFSTVDTLSIRLRRANRRHRCCTIVPRRALSNQATIHQREEQWTGLPRRPGREPAPTRSEENRSFSRTFTPPRAGPRRLGVLNKRRRGVSSTVYSPDTPPPDGGGGSRASATTTLPRLAIAPPLGTNYI